MEDFPCPLFYSIKKIKDSLGYHRVRVYNTPDILKHILSLRIKAQERKQDSLYLVCAPEGGGKSLFTMLAYTLYSELKGDNPQIENITRNVEELMSTYARLQRNAFVSLDEAQELASDRWNEKKSKEIKEKFTVMRERAFISMICYPNPLKVNLYFREDRIRGVFFIKKPGVAYYYANSMENPHFANILDTWDKYNKSRTIKLFARYAPDFIMYYPEYKGALREAYDKRKDDNISKVLNNNSEKYSKPDNYMTNNEAAAYLNITIPTFLKYIKLDKIKTVHFGLNNYVVKEELDNLIAEKHSKKRFFNDLKGKDALINKGSKNISEQTEVNP